MDIQGIFQIATVYAQAQMSVGGQTPASNIVNLPQLVSNVYNFAYLIGGLLAFGAVVYGAVRYTFSAGNSSAQSDARDQITQAAFGLLLLLGSYVVLNTLSPNLTSFKFPSLKTIEGQPPVQIGPTPAPGGGLTQEQAMTQLQQAGITVVGGINMTGVQQATINELLNLKKVCSSCEVVVTSLTGGEHATGSCSHGNGFKADLRITGSLTNYIKSNFRYAGMRGGTHPGPMYQANSGAVYVQETNPPHWDMSVPC